MKERPVDVSKNTDSSQTRQRATNETMFTLAMKFACSAGCLLAGKVGKVKTLKDTSVKTKWY